MKHARFFLKTFWIGSLFMLCSSVYAQQHCRNGNLKCGGGGGWAVPAKPPAAKPIQSNEPANLLSLLGRRCDDVQALSPAECKTTQDDAYADGCITLDERNWLHSKSYSILCAAGRPIFVCPCSCFDRDVAIMTRDIEDPLWVKASEISAVDQVVTLADDINLSDIDGSSKSFMVRDIDYITSGPETPDLYVLVLSNGKELAVSEHHALMLDDGYMITAKEATTNHRLLAYTGEPVEIKNVIRRQAADGYVYNFLVKGSSAEAHLIIAEGVIVGDTMWQGSWSDLPGEKIIE